MVERLICSQGKHEDEYSNALMNSVKKRSGFYIMRRSGVQAFSRLEEKPAQEIYLNKDLIDKIRLTGEVNNEKILELLKDCAGVNKLVHSIGVSIEADQCITKSVDFVFECCGKDNKHPGKIIVKKPCFINGTENIIKLEDYQWPEDDSQTKICFEFESPGETAVVSIKFYLKDGYEVSEIIDETAVDFGSNDYKEMITKSLLYSGNNIRLKNAIEKAERGEDVTIAYIGGSITQGVGAVPVHTECYAYKSYLLLKKMFGRDNDSNIHFVKAGVSGTPSELGMIRYEREVLKYGRVKPDIVIVEFAVNDESDETKGNCYESLVRRILSGENRPAVILLFSVFINDWNLQDRLSPVGRLYNLPMVSIKDAVVPQFRLTKEQGNIISKRQYFYDIYHPTNDGHTVMADCLGYLFTETARAIKDKEDITIDEMPIIGNSFENIRLLDRRDNVYAAKIEEGSFCKTDKDLQMVERDFNSFSSPEFPYNWMHSLSDGNESFKMTIESKSLFLVFKDSGQFDFGKADIFVDDKYITTADPRINNWTHCHTVILYNEEVCRTHQIEIRMNEDSIGKHFTILGFAYT